MKINLQYPRVKVYNITAQFFDIHPNKPFFNVKGNYYYEMAAEN